MVGFYCQDVEDVALAEIKKSGSFICLSLKCKTIDAVKVSSPMTRRQNHSQFTFDVSKANEIFDFLVKDKFITFLADHQVPKKEELKGKEYCKYHNSFNHAINSCCASNNIVQD